MRSITLKRLAAGVVLAVLSADAKAQDKPIVDRPPQMPAAQALGDSLPTSLPSSLPARPAGAPVQPAAQALGDALPPAVPARSASAPKQPAALALAEQSTPQVSITISPRSQPAAQAITEPPAIAFAPLARAARVQPAALALTETAPAPSPQKTRPIPAELALPDQLPTIPEPVVTAPPQAMPAELALVEHRPIRISNAPKPSPYTPAEPRSAPMSQIPAATPVPPAALAIGDQLPPPVHEAPPTKPQAATTPPAEAVAASASSRSRQGLLPRFRNYVRTGWQESLHSADIPPLGQEVHMHGRAMVLKGEATLMVLHDFDFVPGGAALSQRGRDQLVKIVRLASCTFHPIIVERTVQQPALADARRQAVLKELAAGSFPIPAERVVIGRSTAAGLAGEEAMIIYKNLANQTQQGGAALSGGGGSGSSQSTGQTGSGTGTGR